MNSRTHTRRFTDKLHFLRRLVANPRAIGAVTPSSTALTRTMVAQIDLSQPGPVLELGPGQGTMTWEILARGIAPELITVIEKDPVFARNLRNKFKNIEIIQGDAFAVDKLLAGHSSGYIAAISSLPLLNFPAAKRNDLLMSVLAKLVPGAPFIQFSYGFKSPVAPPPGVTVNQAAVVWRNIPPARVWVYRAENQSGSDASSTSPS